MKFIETLSDGMRISEVYLCRQKTIALTRNGKEYGNVVLQDRTGQIDAKIWDLGSPAIHEFEAMDYIRVDGMVTVFNNANQLNIQRVRTAAEGEYDPADYFPVSSFGIDDMQKELLGFVSSIREPHLKELCEQFFVRDESFSKRFSRHSAAKSVHHGFIGGLLEHTLSVTKLCDFAAQHYPYVNRDLLIAGAMLHDIGKVYELTAFPTNEYTDAGQLLGHIIIGSQLIEEKIRRIEGFPLRLHNELIHLILSHHGELEFGSPKKPALMEAFILSFADNMDAKVETLHEIIESKAPVNDDGWFGFQKLLDTNVRKTSAQV